MCERTRYCYMIRAVNILYIYTRVQAVYIRITSVVVAPSSSGVRRQSQRGQNENKSVYYERNGTLIVYFHNLLLYIRGGNLQRIQYTHIVYLHVLFSKTHMYTEQIITKPELQSNEENFMRQSNTNEQTFNNKLYTHHHRGRVYTIYTCTL